MTIRTKSCVLCVCCVCCVHAVFVIRNALPCILHSRMHVGICTDLRSRHLHTSTRLHDLALTYTADPAGEALEQEPAQTHLRNENWMHYDIHELTHSYKHTPASARAPALAPALTHSHTHALAHSRTHILTHSHTLHSHTHTLTHSRTHART